MRQERIIQASLFDFFAQHEIGRELKAMSQWLDEHSALLGLVAGGLRRHGIPGDRNVNSLPTATPFWSGPLGADRLEVAN